MGSCVSVANFAVQREPSPRPSATAGRPQILKPKILLCLLAGLFASVAPAWPASGAPGQTRSRESVLQRRARVAANLDVMRAEESRVDAALASLNADVDVQEGLLRTARWAAEQAEARAGRARAEERRLDAEVGELANRVKALAVRRYVGQDDPGAPWEMLDVSDVGALARRSTLVRAAVGSTRDTRDLLEAALEDQALLRREAEEAANKAAAHRGEEARRLKAVAQARDRQAGFAVQLDKRIEASLAEAASLERLDRQLSAEIQERQRALSRQNRIGPGLSGGGIVRRGQVPLQNVRGIWVHQSIAASLERLLAAAEADGVRFGGGGYRNPEDQRRLREANCADADNSPPSSCRPPTARPGQSMHEQGLAVDFTYGGQVIRSRSSPGYRWLEGNARRFGLSNLPSEPWHWSTNGN